LGDAGRAPTEVEIAKLVHAKRPVYLRRAVEEAAIFPGASALLRAALAAGPTAIVSGALRHEIEAALARMELLDDVRVIVSAEDTRACKPDPEGYLLGIEALARVSDRDIVRRGVAIEDSPGGVRAAKAAGLAVIAVLHSVARDALASAGADHIVERVGDIDVAMLRDVAARAHGG
jgi:HAD superfamily hydrolase (TIGR01509 family)